MTSFNFHKKVLSNGLRLITVPMPWTETVTLLALFGVGSRYESEKLSGAAHFIEHMMFKGTERRPSTLEISRELDRIGAEYNAYTAKDHTGYWITTTRNKFDVASDVLFDMLLHSKFAEAEVERERKVILEEIKMYNENPLMHIEDLFDEFIFAGHALGRNIAGTKETMAGIGRKELVDFKKSFYEGKQAVIVVAGKIDNKILRQVEKYARSFPKGADRQQIKDEFKFVQSKKIKLHQQKVDQVQLALGFPAYNFLHPHLSALRLMNVILGGNMSSRLFFAVRERRGLAYFVRSDIESFFDVGSLKVRAGLDAARIEEAIKIIIKELNNIRRGVSAKELKDAKEFFHGRMALSLEGSAEQAEWSGKQELLLSKIMTPAERLAEIDKVNLEEVKLVANEIIRKDRLYCALIGPWKDSAKFRKLIS